MTEQRTKTWEEYEILKKAGLVKSLCEAFQLGN